MAIQWTRSASPSTESCLAAVRVPVIVRPPQTVVYFWTEAQKGSSLKLRASAIDHGGKSGCVDSISRRGSNYINNNRKGRLSCLASVPNSNYVVPMDKSSCITRPLGEILRDLNKRIPDNIIKITANQDQETFIPWYHANRMLSFYAPGWCGEVRDVIFSDNGSVTVVYRVTIRGSDGEAHRESTGTVSSSGGHGVDPVAAAEEIAFCRACSRFGLGLYLYHDE